MTYSKIRDKLSLTEIVKGETGMTLHQGVNDCPVCKRKKKFYVYSDKAYKCFHPSCDANSGGDVWSLLTCMGVTESFKQSYLTTSKYVSADREILEEHRYTNLAKLFTFAKEQATLKEGNKAIEYLKERNIYTPELDYGYIPYKGLLPFFSKEILETCGVLNSNGRELFNGRIIFPFYDKYNNIVHIQGRSLDPKEELRWISSTTLPGMLSINNYVYNYIDIQDTVVLCEGVTDTLSLSAIGVPAIGCTGLETNLVRAIGSSKISNLVAIFDNDKFPIGYGNLSGQYKSWSSILKKLVELKEYKPELNIWCCSIPTKVGKDINDWLVNGLTKDMFNKHLNENSVLASSFAIDIFKDNIENHVLMWRWALQQENCVDKIDNYVKDNYSSVGSYLMELFGNGNIFSLSR